MAWAFAILTLGLAAAVYVQTRDNRESRERDRETAAKNVAQAKFQTYILCRSTGRTVKQCNTIAKGAVLPGSKIQLQQIEAALAKFGEATVNKLFVGPPGSRGSVGPGGTLGPPGPKGAKGDKGSTGARGPQGQVGEQGPPGPTVTGARGAQGPRGLPGERGAAGAQGPQGAAGPAGPAGPPGEICPGLRIVTVSIPSAGTFKIPVCP